MGSSSKFTRKVGPLKDLDIARTDSPVHCSLSSRNRSATDVFFLVFFVLFLLGLVWLIILNIHHDILEFLGEFKYCRSSYECILPKVCYTSLSFSEFKNYLLSHGTQNSSIWPTDSVQSFLSEVAEDFRSCWKTLILLPLLGISISSVIIMLYRYFIGSVILFITWGTVTICSAMSIILWFIWWGSKILTEVELEAAELEKRKIKTYFIFALSGSFVTIILSIILFALRKRIELMITIFEESGKVIGNMAILLFQPMLTLVCLGLTISFSFYFYAIIEKSEMCLKSLSYEHETLTTVTKWYLFLGVIWFGQFIVSCQHMIIAGAVSQCYFKRTVPLSASTMLLRSYYNLIRFHLGSVALGSFLNSFSQIMKILLKFVPQCLNKSKRKCVECCVRCSQCWLCIYLSFLKYFSRNAYIEIAVNGYNFCYATKEAFRLVSSNFLIASTINWIGHFVLFIGKIATVAVAVVSSIYILKNCQIQHLWVPVTLIGLFTYFISHCFILVYEMTIETIFLCFCEDFEKNNGIDKPYCMSRNLMRFVDKSKKFKTTDRKRYIIPTVSENID